MSCMSVNDIVIVPLITSPPMNVLGIVKEFINEETAIIFLGNGFEQKTVQVPCKALQILCSGKSIELSSLTKELKTEKFINITTKIIRESSIKLSDDNRKRVILSSSSSEKFVVPVNVLRVLCALIDSLSSWRSPLVTLEVLFFGFIASITFNKEIGFSLNIEKSNCPVSFYSLMRLITLLIALTSPIEKSLPPKFALFFLGIIYVTAFCDWLYEKKIHLWFVIISSLAIFSVFRGVTRIK